MFRTLTRLEEVEIVRRIGLPQKTGYYVLNTPDVPCNYLVCRRCGRMSELPPLDLALSVQKAATICGFQRLSYELNIYGVCPSCQKRSRCAVLSEKSTASSERGVKSASGAGISGTAVPVRLGEKLVGFLHTGQVVLGKTTVAGFDRTAKVVGGWEVDVDAPELRDAYFGTRVLSTKQYTSVVGLLTVFAEHLSMVSNQLLVQEATAEPPVITRAKQFINTHYGEAVSLGQVAKAVNMSLFYFCKLFRRATGVKFTEYLSSVRIEKAKNLLLNRNMRICEIGYEVGFQSLTHFNRVFKTILGRSPTEYRDLLPIAGIGKPSSIVEPSSNRHRPR